MQFWGPGAETLHFFFVCLFALQCSLQDLLPDQGLDLGSESPES